MLIVSACRVAVFNHQTHGPLEIFGRAECFEDPGEVEVLSIFVTYCSEILVAQNKSREGVHVVNLLHQILEHLVLFTLPLCENRFFL
jgi:hypothetical protein